MARYPHRSRGQVDVASIADLFSGPGQDTRQWISYGTVQKSTEGEDGQSVIFDDEYGPLVNVTLWPTNMSVRARVGSIMAGSGEGYYFPFVENDEVLVAIPEGDERADCVIISRLNNALDTFPATSVGGQDPSTNSFGFMRSLAPFIFEFGGSFMLRNAPTGAMLACDQSGTLTFRDGFANGLQFSATSFAFLDATGQMALQVIYDETRIVLQAGDALLKLEGSSGGEGGAGYLVSPGPLTIALGTNSPAEHVATTEFVLACLQLVLSTLLPISGSPAALTALNLAVAAGGVPLAGPFLASLPIGLAIAGSTPKPPPVGGVQAAPTLGAVLLTTG